MRFLDLTLPSPEENLALDEALLLEAEADRGGEVMRLWEWPKPAVILGAGCRLADEVDEAACVAAGVPILRRSSGGGTVLLGPGCLLYSLVLNFERSPELEAVRSSYGYVLGRVAEALADVASEIAWAGISDLASAGRKFSGNAQQRKRRFLLHHGTLLYNFSLGHLARFLRPPPRQPDYRAGREHEAFLMNLPISAGELKARLQRGWNANSLLEWWPTETVSRLVSEKYTLSSWTWRR